MNCGIKAVALFTGGIDHVMYSFKLACSTPSRIFVQTNVLRLYHSPIDAEFEYKVIKSMRSNHIPVPKAYKLERDAGVVGSPFVTMEKVGGDNLTNIILSKIAANRTWFDFAEAADLVAQYARLLADIHHVNNQKSGLGFLKTSDWTIESLASFDTPPVKALAERFPEQKALMEWVSEPCSVPFGKGNGCHTQRLPYIECNGIQ